YADPETFPYRYGARTAGTRTGAAAVFLGNAHTRQKQWRYALLGESGADVVMYGQVHRRADPFPLHAGFLAADADVAATLPRREGRDGPPPCRPHPAARGRPRHGCRGRCAAAPVQGRSQHPAAVLGLPRYAVRLPWARGARLVLPAEPGRADGGGRAPRRRLP